MDDNELQRDVIDELDVAPGIDATRVGVMVDNGVVTLTGHVPTYSQKIETESAVWRVAGVHAIVQKMDVHRASDGPTDEELAHRALGLLRWDSTVPSSIHVKVVDGWITFEGTVRAEYQRTNAERSLARLDGLRGFHNLIRIGPAAKPDGGVHARPRRVSGV